jgi:hypothetical protein
MGNPETLVTLETQDTGRRQQNKNAQHRKLKKMSNMHPLKNRVEPRC